MTRPRSSAEPPAAQTRRVLVLLLVAAVCTLLATDYARVPNDPITKGDVAARTVRAPFSFSYQDLDAFEADRARANDASPVVFLYDPVMLTEAEANLTAAFDAARQELDVRLPLPEEEDAAAPTVSRALATELLGGLVRDVGVPVAPADLVPLARARFPAETPGLILDWLGDAYDEQLVVADRSRVPSAEHPMLVVPRVGDRAPFELGDDRRLAHPDDVRRALKVTAVAAKRTEPWAGAAEAIAMALIKPNLVYDEGRTEEARVAAVAAVSPEPIRVKRTEILFREGDLLTARHVAMYSALQNSRTDHGVLLELAAIFAFLTLTLGTLYGVLRERFRDTREGFRDLAASGLLIVLAAVASRVVVASAPGIAAVIGNEAQATSVWYLAPVAASAMLARVLMGRQRAVFVLVGTVAVTALMMQLDAMYVLYFLLTGLVAGGLAGRMHERLSVLKAGVITGAFGALTVLLIHFVQLYVGDGELSMAAQIRPVWSMLFALAGGLLSGFALLALIPLFEALGFVTDYRMLELASLNHPLMRQLMLRAPGTYHHSVIVGTLAEAACEAIGANGLQAKISAYFHDIGKALKPGYFVENQRGGVNRHDELDPVTSAQVIISHVTEGERMAKEHNLPQPILDNIVQHHGTGLLQFFFAKAQMQADDPSSIDESLFRYPGPKPNTREAGVVLLADKVEAATRTIQNPTEDNIRAMINRIINSVMADDQFSQCPLTFREIYTIADTFVRVLMGIYHQRIEYPQTRAISQAGTGEGHASIAGQPGTITLDLDKPSDSQETAGLWNDEELDEAEDYEAVRNLPSREP